MPIGSLPPKAAKIFESVYQKLLSEECKGDKECASKRAWGAVKNAGYYKGKDGKWHKRSAVELSVAEMSLYISKASFDKKTQQMRWLAVASDTDRDDYEDRMSIELYNDFIRRAVEKESPPEELCTESWCGGMPYVSVSHYPDLDGNGIAGPTNNLYVDGQMLKARGLFNNTKLGRACFNSICEDLYSEEKSDDEEKIRISIGFIDWAHYHGDFYFERANLTDQCPMCALGVGDKIFAKGHLLHLALTRIPVNTRTDILPLVEESMTTRKEDAESIVGEELAEELEEEAKLVGKSEAVVERADDDEVEAVEEKSEEVEEEVVEGENIETPEEETPDMEVADSQVEDVEPEAEEEDNEVQELSKKLDAITEILNPSPSEPHVLNTVFNELRAQFDEVSEMDLTPDEKLQLLQDPFAEIGNVLRSAVTDEPEQTEESSAPDTVTRAELAEIINPLTEQVSLLIAQLEGGAGAQAVRSATPQRRSISAQELRGKVSEDEKPNSLKSIARASTIGRMGY